MKIWHISDTHNLHENLVEPDVDLIIFSGDCSNSKNPIYNIAEVNQFINWFTELKCKNKIFVAGNHDTSIEHGFINKRIFKENSIIYLENETVYLNELDLYIYGSPYTPKFGHGWSFNMDRDKLYDLWNLIPDYTNIIVTHGPPYGYLDLVKSNHASTMLNNVGCEALSKQISKLKNLKLCCFGHIHNNSLAKNSDLMINDNTNIIYSNASIAADHFYNNNGYLYNNCNGNLITL